MWHWPLPGFSPWELPRGSAKGSFGLAVNGIRNTGIVIDTPPNTTVCAVEDGQAVWVRPTEGVLVVGTISCTTIAPLRSVWVSGWKRAGLLLPPANLSVCT